MSGEKTFEIAKEIAKKCPKYNVFCAHNQKDRNIPKNMKIHKTRLCLAETKSHSTTISDCDISIVYEKIILAIFEIEEKNEIVPKKMFGDIIPFILAKSCYIDGTEYYLNDRTQYAVFGLSDVDGQKNIKIDYVINQLKKIDSRRNSIGQRIAIIPFKANELEKIIKYIQDILKISA